MAKRPDIPEWGRIINEGTVPLSSRLLTSLENSKPKAPIVNRRTSWQPPSKERLNSVDLGPLKSPIISNSSYRSSSKRSSISTDYYNRDRELADLVSNLGLEKHVAKIEERSQGWKRSGAKVSFSPLRGVSTEDTQILERKDIGGRGKGKEVENSRGALAWPLRISSKKARRPSESSEDEVFGQIIQSPTVRYA